MNSVYCKGTYDVLPHFPLISVVPGAHKHMPFIHSVIFPEHFVFGKQGVFRIPRATEIETY